MLSDLNLTDMETGWCGAWTSRALLSTRNAREPLMLLNLLREIEDQSVEQYQRCLFEQRFKHVRLSFVVQRDCVASRHDAVFRFGSLPTVDGGVG
jgi:hypothetical protein